MDTASDETVREHSAGGRSWMDRRPRLHRNLNRAVVGMLIVFALGQIYMRFLSNHPAGMSLPNLITYGMVVLSTIVLLAWLVFCSRFPRGLVWAIVIPVVLGIGGLIASVRSVRFDGDMAISFDWKWEPTNDQILEDWLKQSGPAASNATATAIEITPEDMAEYRGAQRDGVVTGPPIREDWSTNPPKVLWKHPVGGGYGQFAVVEDFIVTIEQRRDQEVVVAYEGSTGREIWAQSWPGKFFEAMGGPGPRSTPTIAEGRVYALGALGHLACLELATGDVVWSRELLKDLHLDNSMWAMTSSPLIVDDRVVVNVGGYYGGGLIALDRATGKDIWKTDAITATADHPPAAVVAALKAPPPPPSDASDAEHSSTNAGGGRNLAGYASPIVVTLEGVRQILNFDGIGLWGHSIDDGKILWFHYFTNQPGVNSAQPIVFPDGRILISASYGVGSRMVRPLKSAEGWNVNVVWGSEEKPNRVLKSKMSSPVLVDGYIYGLDEAILVCMDPATGKRLWKGSNKHDSRGRYGHGQLLVTNGLILVLTERGDIVLVRPSPKELIELGFMHVLDGEKTWNPPALSRGKLYIRNHHEMASVDLCTDSSSTSENIADDRVPPK